MQVSWRWWGAALVCLTIAWPMDAGKALGSEDAPDFAAEITALDGDDAAARDRAEAALVAGGLAAVEALAGAAAEGSLERRFRATRVLGRLALSQDEATVKAARKALEEIAEHGEVAIARQAREELAPFTRLDQMLVLAKAFKLLDVARPEQSLPVPLVERPLLRFEDQERTHYDGTLWAFQAHGRPHAFLCVYSRIEPGNQPAWASDVVTVSAGPLLAEAVDGIEGRDWSPKSREFEFQPYPNSPPAAKDADARLVQALDLTARLTARESWPPSAPAKALTLSAEPLLRYSEPNAGVVDGMVFAFMHATNPEILLLLEVQKDGETLEWRYQLARQGAASLWVELDGKELWAGPSPANYQAGGDRPYWNFRRSAAR